MSTAAISKEVLYGDRDFQVRLWSLPAGATVTPYPQATGSDSQNLVVAGQLSVGGGIGSVRSGQRFELASQSQCAIRNDAEQTALILEILSNGPFEPVPLAEITETRPWGSFTVLKDESDYKLKQLRVKPGSRLSLQRHSKREEHWLVIRGCPEVTLDDAVHALSPGAYIHIPLQSWHRIANPETQTEDVEIIELQLGKYFGEDDIERREDDYGRC